MTAVPPGGRAGGPEGKEHHRGADENQHAAGGEQAHRDPAEEVHLHAEGEVGGYARRRVRIHHHDRPGALAGGPRERHAGTGRLRRPERLFRRRRCRWATGAGAVLLRQRPLPAVHVNVDHLVVGDARQVGRHVGCRGDPDEQRLAVARAALCLERGDVARRAEPVGQAVDEPQSFTRHRKARARECRRGAREEASVVALARVRPQNGAATSEEAKADQGEERADDAEDDPAAARPGRRTRLCLWTGTHDLTTPFRGGTARPDDLTPRDALDASST